MSAELFDIPPSAPDRLTTARKRLADAQKAYDDAVRADEEFDGFGIVPIQIKQDVRDATRALREIETEEYEKAKRA